MIPEKPSRLSDGSNGFALSPSAPPLTRMIDRDHAEDGDLESEEDESDAERGQQPARS